KGRDFFGRRGFGVMFEQIGIFQKLRYQDAQTIAQLAIDAFTSGDADRVMLVYNEFKSVMSQRVVVDQLLPIARAEIDNTSMTATAAERGERLRPAPSEQSRGAASGGGAPRAARIERRVLRRADDGDGHRDEEFGGDDREPDALYEQGAAGRNHARDHRSRVGRRGTLKIWLHKYNPKKTTWRRRPLTPGRSCRSSGRSST